MYSRIFLDANIFLDAVDVRRPTHEISTRVIGFLLQHKHIQLFTSCDLITTIYYILAKTDASKALAQIEKLNTFTTIIDFSNSEITLTCKLMQSDRDYSDLEDTLQYILAQKAQCDLILSNDTDFVSKEITLMSTTAFSTKFLDA